MTSKIIGIELRFDGDGTVRRVGNEGFSGGVAPPTLAQEIGYLLHRAILGPEDGLLIAQPRGRRTERRRYFLALAELDSCADPDHHQHFDGVHSEDGRTVVDIIIRKGLGDGGVAV